MNGINRQVEELILTKRISPRKVRNLIFVKEFIDRMAQKPYLPKEQVDKIEKKFGQKPDIITWGDYFQAEIAGDHWDEKDSQFERTIQTVVFDVIASIMIFSGKSAAFIKNVEMNFETASALQLKQDSGNVAIDTEEHLHLGILLNYFNEMGLNMNSLSEEDFSFFQQFAVSAQAV